MVPAEVIKVLLEVFAANMSRVRWFLLSALILSGALLFHMFIEQYGQDRAQVEQILRNRILPAKPQAPSPLLTATAQCEAALVTKLENPNPPDTEKFLKDYEALRILREGAVQPIDCTLIERERLLRESVQKMSGGPAWKMNAEQITELSNLVDTEHARIVGREVMSGHRLAKRELPFMGMEIPANDYTPIVSVLLAMVCLGLWLNCRFLLQVYQDLLETRDAAALRLAQHQFMFTTDRHDRAGLGLQAILLCIPILAVALLIYLERGSVESLFGQPGIAFGNLALRFSMFLGSLLVITWSCGTLIYKTFRLRWEAPPCEPGE